MMAGRGDNDLVAVPVSAVITASFCPTRLFLERRSGISRAQGPKYTICRQIASHLGEPLDADTLWDEVLAIDPGMDPGMRTFLENCIARCNEGGPWVPPRESDVPFHSDRYGLYGNIDKLFDTDPRFAIVRASPAPPVGVAGPDRLRVFGYMLLLSDAAGIETSSGSVEYIPSGVTRTYFPHPIDKRRFLHALRSAREIFSGKAPSRIPGPRCRSCPSHSACFPMGKRLSDIL
jgi:CRISPR-associated exonuclease Cas4